MLVIFHRQNALFMDFSDKTFSILKILLKNMINRGSVTGSKLKVVKGLFINLRSIKMGELLFLFIILYSYHFSSYLLTISSLSMEHDPQNTQPRKHFTPEKHVTDTQAILKLITTPYKQEKDIMSVLDVSNTPTKKLLFSNLIQFNQSNNEPNNQSEFFQWIQGSLQSQEQQSQKLSEAQSNTVRKAAPCLAQELKHSNDTLPMAKSEVRKCKCSNSKCIKKYCQCFRAGLICGLHCQCTGCENTIVTRQHQSNNGKKQHEETRCKCRKSHCMKGYCQCHSAGKKCGPECNCTECDNLQQEIQNQQYYRSNPIKMIKPNQLAGQRTGSQRR